MVLINFHYICSKSEKRENKPVNLRYFPPSIEIVCPLIQLACSDAKNKTPLAMSCAVPGRFRAMLFKSDCCPAAPMAAHWRSVLSLDRMKPGAMQLTVMPKGGGKTSSK